MTEEEILNKYGAKSEPKDEAAILNKYGVQPDAERVVSAAPKGKMAAILDSPWVQSFLHGHVKNADQMQGDMESFTAPASLVRAGISRYVNGVKNAFNLDGKNLSPEMPGTDFHSALRGKAPGIDEVLNKQVGLPKIISTPAGFVGNALTDPYGNFVGSRGFNQLAEGVVPETNTMLRALTLRAPKDYSTLKPVGDAVGATVGEGSQATGKWFHRLPFRKADEEVTNFRDAGQRGAHEVSDIFWNNGNPISGAKGMSGKQISRTAQDLAKEEWEQGFGQMLKDAPQKIDLAPAFTEMREQAKAGAMEKELQKVIKMAASGDEELQKRALTRFAELQKEDVQQAIMAAGEDAFVKKHKAQLARQFAGGPNEHAKAIEQLKSHMPEFADDIDKLAELHKAGDSALAQAGLNQLVEVGHGGQRTLEEIHQLANKFGQKPTGSLPLNTNAYRQGSKVTHQAAEQMRKRATLADLLENEIQAAYGEEGLARFQASKKKYSALSRGKTPLVRNASQVENTPAISKLDAFLLSRAAASGNPADIVEFAVPKATQAVTKWPRAGTAIGVNLNNLGKTLKETNAFDRGILYELLKAR